MLPPDKIERLPNLLLFSRVGFTDGLKRLANDRVDVELVDLARLYRGEWER